MEALHAALYIITLIWRVNLACFFFCEAHQGFDVLMHYANDGTVERK